MPKANIKFNDFIYRKYKWIITTSLLSLILSSFLFSETYYADSTGTDNAFCSQSDPCEHIQTAIDLTIDGDSVIVSEGTYYENILIETAITLQGEDPLNSPVIDGSMPDPDDWNGSCVVVKTPRGRSSRISAVIENMKMTGGTGTIVIEDSNKDGDFDDVEDISKKVGGGIIVSNANLVSKKNKIKNNGDSSTEEGGAVYAAGSGAGVPDPDPHFPPDPDYDERSSIVFEETIFSGNDAQIGNSVMVNGWDPDTTQFLNMDFGNSNFDVVFDSEDNDEDGVSEYWVKGKDNAGFDFTGGITGEYDAITDDVWVDPIEGTDEGNILGDQDHPFLTIDYAMGLIYLTEENPITIYFTAGTFSPSENGETFPIIMLSNLNLIGQEQELTILDAEGTEQDYRRVIVMENSEFNTISNLTIKGGYEDNGGGIYCDLSSPTLSNVIISDNTANLRGGGIYCENHSNPTLTDVIITGNSTLFNAEFEYQAGEYNTGGGGIYGYLHSSPTLSNVIISENITSNHGGGIYGYLHSSPTLSNVIISDNIATARGGGIYCDTHCDLNLTESEIKNNTSATGGGIYIIGGNPTLSDVLIAGNSANGWGGGIYMQADSPLFSNVTVSDNTSFDSGGGMYIHGGGTSVFSDIYVSDNISEWDGGGIYITSSQGQGVEYFFSNLTVRGNEAKNDAGGISLLNGGNINFNNAVIDSNYIVDQCGACGGGIKSQTSNTSFSNVIISENDPTGIYIQSDSTIFSNTSITGNSSTGLFCRYCDYLSISNSSISQNTALWGAGGIYVDQTDEAILDNVIITGNSCYADLSSCGGGLGSQWGSKLYLSDVIISNNFSTGRGGGMCMGDDDEILFSDNVRIEYNYSGHYGGGLYHGGFGTIDNFIIKGNTAYNSGGGIYAAGQITSISNTIIDSNLISHGSGAGMYLDAVNTNISNVSIINNYSYGGAGGIFISNNNAEFNDVIIERNISDQKGGGMWIFLDSNVNAKRLLLVDNYSTGHGGGLFIQAGANIDLINSTIATNMVGSGDVFGAGIYSDGGNVSLANSIVYYNRRAEDYSPQYNINGWSQELFLEYDISYSDIEGEEDWIPEGEGNISVDPEFIDFENSGDYTLQEGSPCIDAGTADTDGDGYDDITNYFGSAPDMGAFEYEGSTLLGDLNGDGLINVLDVVVLVNIVLGMSEPIDAGDLNGDGMLNVLDVVALVNMILEGR